MLVTKAFQRRCFGVAVVSKSLLKHQKTVNDSFLNRHFNSLRWRGMLSREAT